MLKYLIHKEFLQLRRNPFLPRLILIFPIVMMCVIPWVMNMEVKNIVVDVVDNDRSTLSQQLVHRIEASNYFIFNGQKTSYAEALNDIERGKADVVVVIPQSLESDVKRGLQPQVLVASNAVNGTKGLMGGSYLTQIVTGHLNPASEALNSKLSTLYLYNKMLNYKLFMIPALMAILLMMMCGFLPALNIVSEKEKGTIQQINVTPVSKRSFILAKLIPYWLIGLLVMTICFVLSWLIYDITCQGHLLYVYMAAVLLALVFSSFGLIISNYSENMQQAVLMMWFIVVCLMLLSGLFTPVRSMPEWAQWFSFVNPMHYFIDAMRTVFVRGGDFQSVSHQLLALAVYALVLGLWAVASYRKNSR